jgi:Skp family chaperone for outer membrane proteins
MKYRFQHTLIIIASILFSLMVSGQRGTKVGYIDMSFILETVDEYNKASKLLDKNIENWKKEIELKKLELEQIQDQLDAERIIFTPELINDREMEIQDFASEIIRLQEKRFGPSGDMIIQRSKLMQPLQDQVMTIVKQVAEENKYDFIFDRSSTATMLYSAKNYDISDLVIKRINRQQKIKKRRDQIEALKSKASSLKN